MIKIIRRSLSWFALLSVVPPATGMTNEVQLELYTDEFPPLQVQVEDKAYGYVVEFLKELVADASKSMAMSINEIHFVPWKRAISVSETQANVLFFSISRTPSREEKYHWIGEVSPYDITLYKYKNGPKIQPHNIEDIIDYRFGTQAGGSFHEYLIEHGAKDILPVTYGRRTIKLLKANRIDYAPLVAESFYYRMEQYGENPEEFEPVMKIDELSKNLWVVASKKTSQEVVDTLIASYKNLRNKGELERLIEAYHPQSEIMSKYRKVKQQEVLE
ncbi:ABC transporter substrate-binding protein [Vibrio hannami]|uniref:substrate-binding periplasmic protein n=1 Tax=Vibrio hannami TaxID=2717094 RepID=UPI0024105E4B|nr:ABC transporter substrate-binding protein [Vibrio hannami]MDG3088174.1 ABC transporter substrate-binding protein [Vibrio hannami]